MLIESQVHPFPVLPGACRCLAVPRGDLLDQRLHICLVGILRRLLGNAYRNGIGIGISGLGRDRICHRLAEILLLARGRCDLREGGYGNGRHEADRRTGRKRQRDGTLHLINGARYRAVGEGQDPVACCHRCAGDGHRIDALGAALGGNSVGIFALLQRGRCGELRKLGNGDLRLYGRQIHRVRDGNGDVVAVDHALRIAQLIGGDVVFRGLLRCNRYLVVGAQIKITVGYRQRQRLCFGVGKIERTAAVKRNSVDFDLRAGMGHHRRDSTQARAYRQVQGDGMIRLVDFGISGHAICGDGKRGDQIIRHSRFDNDTPCGT